MSKTNVWKGVKNVTFVGKRKVGVGNGGKIVRLSGKKITVDAFANAEDAVTDFTGVEDVLLLDINLPGMSGIEAIPKIKALLPELKIIMLTMLDDDNTVLEAILSGADGYLLKKNQAFGYIEGYYGLSIRW